MWPSIKRWRDWAMDNLWPLYRIGPQPQALHYSYEKAGLVLHDQPIPWNAEAVLVEAQLRLPTAAGRRKAGLFSAPCARPAADPRRAVMPPHIGRHRGPLPRRLSPSAAGRHRRRRGAAVPGDRRRSASSRCRSSVARRSCSNCGLQMPTLFVRLGDESVSCQTFVSSQCRGLLASAVLSSPTSLVPLLDLEACEVEFRSVPERRRQHHPLAGDVCPAFDAAGRPGTGARSRWRRETAIPTDRLGAWTATWLLGDRPLAAQRVRGILAAALPALACASPTRASSVQNHGEPVRLTRCARCRRWTRPSRDWVRVSSSAVASRAWRPGAGCQVTAQVLEAVQPPLLLEQDVLITDGPTMVAPGTLDAADLHQVSGFELSVRRPGSLGLLSLCPAPAANVQRARADSNLRTTSPGRRPRKRR